MERANSSSLTEAQVLVVPPFECAWLTGENALLREGKGCVSFDVKGDNDVTVIFKQQCGSRRWQHLSSGRQSPEDSAAEGRESPVEANYTVILGSHRNTCLKFEKDGELCHQVSNAPGSTLSATRFTQFWVNYNGGSITVGSGEPSASTACYSWTDADPIPNIRFAGLSAWDKHVGYRNIKVQPAVNLAASRGAPAARQPPSVPTLVELCCQAALRALTPGNVCAVLTATDAIAPVTDGLRARAIEFAAGNFIDVLERDPAGFQGLTAESLGDILRSNALVCREKAVFDAVLLWAASSEDFPACLPATDATRYKSAYDLTAILPLIRFPLMSDEDLAAVTSHPMGSTSQLLGELIREAVDARRSFGSALGAASVRAGRLLSEPSPMEAAASARFQRRRPARNCTELIYMYDGDRNGACYHVATRFGTQQWVNPVSAGLLTVRASSPNCRFTDPRALMSRNFLRTNFAGPRREGGALVSWWQLDLGEGHALECSFYTLRHDASSDFLRNWALQGSNDGATWVDLRRHVDDGTFRLRGQYASWPVTGPTAAEPYRLFRVALLAPSRDAVNPHHVCLSHLELYGNFMAPPQGEAGAGGPAV